MERSNLGEYSVATVYCLCIDMIESTQAGLELSTASFDRFNKSLVKQIKPHLENLGLAHNILKFTGDGWLLMTHDVNEVSALCCLATVMAKRFQNEMSQLTEIALDHIPQLRLAICSGRDMLVKLPDGREDWVGDSARRAVRASGCCFPNEILIDEPVRYPILRDFDTKPADVEKRFAEFQSKKTEEIFPLHVLGELKLEAATEPKAPEYFVYALGQIGKVEEAKAAGQRIAERLTEEAIKLDITDKESLQRNLRSWNRLLASLPDYSSGLKMLEGILAAGLAPDVVTYSTLVDKAPDYNAAKTWVKTMRAEGIQPDVVTYSTLISKAPDYDVAKALVDTMREERIQPNVVTYSTLVDKAPDYNAAKTWVKTMRAEGIQPNIPTYTALFSKDLSHKSADHILEWYLGQEYHPEEPIQAAIATYRRVRCIEEALRLTLDYPHLQAARKLIREHEEEALSYFRTLADNDPEHPNASYALGVALMELRREQEARPHLKKALRLARAGPRKAVIREWLRQIDGKPSQNGRIQF